MHVIVGAVAGLDDEAAARRSDLVRLEQAEHVVRRGGGDRDAQIALFRRRAGGEGDDVAGDRAECAGLSGDPQHAGEQHGGDHDAAGDCRDDVPDAGLSIPHV